MFNQLKDKVIELSKQLYAWLKEKHTEKVTVMLIPHTEKKILNFHISVLYIGIFVSFISLGILMASIAIISRSGTRHAVKQLKLSNIEYKQQREKIREEIKPMHDLIMEFTQLTGKLRANARGEEYDINDAIGGPETDELIASLDQDTELDTTGQSPADAPVDSEVSLDRTSFTGGNIEFDLPAEIALLKQGVHNMQLTRDWGEETIEILKKQRVIIRHTPTIWPVKGHIMNPYGEYIDPFTGKNSFNRGIDIGALPGTEILTTADGIVHRIYEHPRFGYTVEVKHRWGFKTVYASLERITVKKEDKVQKGDVLGFIGSSAYSNQHMLHYELWVGTSYMDPFPFLNKLVD